jgi:two-component system phosphate regulon response regulator PhoB
MNPKVLIVGAEPKPADQLRRNLEREGFHIVTVRTPDQLLSQIAAIPPNVILLDTSPEPAFGIEIIQQIRLSPSVRGMPVVVMASRADGADRLRWFKAGADDYIAKPFSMADLISGLHAAMKRTEATIIPEVLRYADVTLDLGALRVTRGHRAIHLGPTEIRLLRFFLQHPHRVFSRENLRAAIWGPDADVEVRTVDVHIRRLRKAINLNKAPDIIRTVRSAGYAMDLAAHPSQDHYVQGKELRSTSIRAVVT